MNQKLDELFQQTINKRLHLRRTGKVWQLKETPPITMNSPNRHSLGFSLDCQSSPYGSLFAGNPPLNITKMCDAIIVLSYSGKDYIFVIEQKANNKEEYKKQLANGKYFCDWLLMLLKEHDHYDGEVVFIGLLCWQPREKSLSKREIRHESRVSSKNIVPCHRFFEVKNKTDIYLLDFIK